MNKLKKISAENAQLEYEKICDAFEWNVDDEVKTQTINLKLGSTDASIDSEIDAAKSIIRLIMSGVLALDDSNKDVPLLKFNLKRTVVANEVKYNSFDFRLFNCAMQAATGVNLNELNGAMNDSQWDSVLNTLLGISDPSVLQKLQVTTKKALQGVASNFLV